MEASDDNGAQGMGVVERHCEDGSREVVDSKGALLLREAGGVRTRIVGGAIVETESNPPRGTTIYL